MAYYPKDAAAVQRLRDQIEALGVPLILMRRFTQLIGAISVQVEEEHASRRVVAAVFAALVQQAEEIGQPESDRIKELIEACRLDVEKRLNRRWGRPLDEKSGLSWWAGSGAEGADGCDWGIAAASWEVAADL